MIVSTGETLVAMRNIAIGAVHCPQGERLPAVSEDQARVAWAIKRAGTWEDYHGYPPPDSDGGGEGGGSGSGGSGAGVELGVEVEVEITGGTGSPI